MTTDRKRAISYYYMVKENIRYGFPLCWVNSATTLRTKVGHCGMKAELLADMLTSDGYSVRYVVGYYVGMIPKFVRTKFMDVHFWIEVLTDNEWLVLDPSPDRFTALISGDTEPGTHLSEPRYISKMDELPPWFKDIYNDWSILAHKIILNIGLSVVRLLIKIGGAKNNGKSTNGSYGSNVWTGYDCGCS